MYSKEGAEIYDAIYASKNYLEESKTILNSFGDQRGGQLLDIGCGTLGHTRHLAHHFSRVLALDTSSDMITRALEVIRENNLDNVECLKGSIESLNPSSTFDLAISMFNVINHVLDLRSLESLVASVAEALSASGVWIFDCWNGNSVRSEVPHETMSRSFLFKNKSVALETRSHTDYRAGTVSMATNLPNWISLFNGEPPVIPELKHRIWTPDLIEELLRRYGFDDVRIFDARDYPSVPNFRETKRLLFRATHA